MCKDYTCIKQFSSFLILIPTRVTNIKSRNRSIKYTHRYIYRGVQTKCTHSLIVNTLEQNDM
jgi:hypothetical protein